MTKTWVVERRKKLKENYPKNLKRKYKTQKKKKGRAKKGNNNKNKKRNEKTNTEEIIVRKIEAGEGFLPFTVGQLKK